MALEVLAVVVTHNSASVVEALLDSIPPGFDGVTYRVVVVDNGSTDDTCRLLRSRTDITLVENENLGYSAGINRGVRTRPDAESVLVLNPDVTLDAGSVRPMLTALRKPGVGIVAPVVREGGVISQSQRRQPTLGRSLGLGRTGLSMFSEYVTEEEAYQRPGDVDWALGAVLLVSMDCHRGLGGWDESYFLYSEETDFCLRARDGGYRTVFEPAAATSHVGGASGQSATTHSIQVVNRVRLYGRRHSRAASYAYLFLSVATEVSWWLRGNPHSRTAVVALLRPSTRPPQLRAARSLIPD